MQIKDLTSEKLINLDLQAKNKEEAIKEIINMLEGDSAVIDLDMIIEGVLAREKISSTAIGGQVAIPHAKTKGIKEAKILVAIAKEGINCEAVDNLPVQLFFMIIVPEEGDDLHLSLLGRLARNLIYDEFKQSFLIANSKEDVLEILKQVKE